MNLHRLISLLYLSVLAGCSCGPESELDTGILADVLLDAPDTPTWEVEVLSRAPCLPWAPSAPLAPATLPADATPRRLWVFDVEEDAAFQAALRASSLPLRQLVFPTLAPDGSVRLFGPDGSSVTSVSADGEFLGLAGQGLAESEGLYFGPPVVDPEGTAWMVSRPTSASPEARLVSYREGMFTPNVVIPNVDSGLTRARVIIGAGGLIAVNYGIETTVTCRGTRAQWRSRSAINPGVSLADGTFWSALDRGWITSPDGTLRAAAITLPVSPIAPHSVSNLAVLSAGRFWFELVAPPFETLNLWLGDGEVWQQIPVGTPTDLGGVQLSSRWVWVIRQEGAIQSFASVEGTTMLSTTRVASGLTSYLPTADGSLLIVENAEPPNLLRLMPDGTIPWRVPLLGSRDERLSGADTAVSLDQRGVLYITNGISQVIAVQTDTLPPPDGTCWIPGCNGRRDSSVSFHTE